ncbi:DUF3419 family protein [Rhizobium sp. PAMB 3174]
MSDIATDIGIDRNRKLKAALLRHKTFSKAGFSERLFGLLFSGMVYPQIWEDPEVDMAAMELQPHHRIVTIGSGGCNMLAYLSASPASIDVVDLNPHHVNLNRLKLAAFRLLPDHRSVVRFLGSANEAENSANYHRHIEQHLDGATRKYWSGRHLTGKRRIRVFDRNIYRTGLLGRFIGAGHFIARAHGVKLEEFTRCKSIDEQRVFFESRIAPLFEKPVIRSMTKRKSSLFGLGIPPQQYDELASLSSDGTVAPVLRHRLEKLACHFPLQDNYFAWQAFARRYPGDGEGTLPDYLKPERYDAIRANTARVSVHHANFTELLNTKSDHSLHRYVLLDAQDWMNDEQLNALWSEITRTAGGDARVIFRTAAEKSIIEGRLDPAIRSQWRYDEERSRELASRDRSAIYGGFHIYERIVQ